MQDLQTLINHLTKGRKLHISILDLCGVLDTPMTHIRFQNEIHSKEFCNFAKSTDRGYRTCLRCKMLANTRATVGQTPFSGLCLYGMHEAAFPVTVNDAVVAVVYVGNTVVDERATVARIQKTCRYTGVDPQRLCAELERCEFLDTPDELFQIAELVGDYLKILFERVPKGKAKLHWLVSLMKRHADETYCTDISLRELAVTYQKNEKYMGRLFKKEMGISFPAYCVGLRLRKAERLIAQSDGKILDIAMECGFNNISYFNRVFKRKHGMSPGTYRDKRRKTRAHS